MKCPMIRRLSGLGVAALIILPAASNARAGLDSYISQQLPKSERDFMHRQLEELPGPLKAKIAARRPSDVTVAIIDGLSGVVHYNHAEDAGRVVRRPADWDMPPRSAQCPPPSITGGVFDPGCAADSGPYRRIYTTPLAAIPRPGAGGVSGYYEIAGYNTIACKDGYPWHNPHNPKDYDVGNVYMGGWSTTPLAPAGNVDAGLQYDWKQRPPLSKDDYGPYLRIAKVGYWSLGKNPPTGAWAGHTDHIPCSDSEFATMAFIVNSIVDAPCSYTKCVGGSYELILDAEYNGTLAELIWQAPGIPEPGPLYGGWGDVYSYTDSGGHTVYQSENPCGGCILKFMSSIAQKSPGNYTDKSRFTVTWFNRVVACWANESCPGGNSQTDIPLTANLVACSEYPMWGAVYNHGTRDCKNTPAGLKGIEKSVGVSGYSPTAETDAISLTY